MKILNSCHLQFKILWHGPPGNNRQHVFCVSISDYINKQTGLFFRPNTKISIENIK